MLRCGAFSAAWIGAGEADGDTDAAADGRELGGEAVMTGEPSGAQGVAPDGTAAVGLDGVVAGLGAAAAPAGGGATIDVAGDGIADGAAELHAASTMETSRQVKARLPVGSRAAGALAGMHIFISSRQSAGD